MLTISSQDRLRHPFWTLPCCFFTPPAAHDRQQPHYATRRHPERPLKSTKVPQAGCESQKVPPLRSVEGRRRPRLLQETLGTRETAPSARHPKPQRPNDLRDRGREPNPTLPEHVVASAGLQGPCCRRDSCIGAILRYVTAIACASRLEGVEGVGTTV